MTKSKALWKRAEEVIWKGGPEAKQWPRLKRYGFPAFISKADGSRFWDVDGNEYVDYLMSWGTVLLGHGNRGVQRAAQVRMDAGPILNLMTEDEVLLAERLVKLIPCAQAVRFLSSGSEATTAAIRVARAATGRSRVIKGGYHGWLDWNQDDHPAGVLPDVVAALASLEYNRLDTLERLFEDDPKGIACIILEPFKDVLPEGTFLEDVLAISRRYGTLLVFDEMKTGFRLALGGAQEYFRVVPDLATFSKALSNGFPLAVLAGSKDVFERAEGAWVNGTYHGWLPSIAAAHATLDVLESEPVIRSLWSLGDQLMEGFNKVMESGGVELRLKGLPPMPRPRFPKTEITLAEAFFRKMTGRGFFLHPNHAWFLSYAHTSAEIQSTIEAAETSLRECMNEV